MDDDTKKSQREALEALGAAHATEAEREALEAAGAPNNPYMLQALREHAQDPEMLEALGVPAEQRLAAVKRSTEQITLRIGEDQLVTALQVSEWLATQPYIEELGKHVSRSDVLRMALDRGLASLRTEMAAGRVQHTSPNADLPKPPLPREPDETVVGVGNLFLPACEQGELAYIADSDVFLRGVVFTADEGGFPTLIPSLFVGDVALYTSKAPLGVFCRGTPGTGRTCEMRFLNAHRVQKGNTVRLGVFNLDSSGHMVGAGLALAPTVG